MCSRDRIKSAHCIRNDCKCERALKLFEIDMDSIIEEEEEEEEEERKGELQKNDRKKNQKWRWLTVVCMQ